MDTEEHAEHNEQDDSLVSRLHVIEAQPLGSRADAYAAVHDELRDVLEGGDVERTHD